MNKRLALTAATAAAACAALLAACGGGSDAPAAPPDPLVSGTDVPQSATHSAAAALTFVSSVAAASSETADPLRVGDATLATSETDDPQLL